MNNFKSKTINITRVRNPSSKIKDNEKNIYERFHTKENIIENNILRVKEEKKKLLNRKKKELTGIKLNNDTNSFNLNSITGENYIISNDIILKDGNVLNNEKNKKKKKPNSIIIMKDGKEKNGICFYV